MVLVAGVDSSTQSCTVVVREAGTGAFVRSGSAPHPSGTEVDPEHWWTALLAALSDAGGLADVAALSVGGQQHGMVCLDGGGRVIRPALLWHDTRSANAAEQLLAELGDGDRERGARAWVEAVGTVPVASLTVTKLRWLADHEPENAARVAAVALPRDWLTWRLAGATGLDTLVTDRSDASGTGYFDAVSGTFRRDLLARALRRTPAEVENITCRASSDRGNAPAAGPLSWATWCWARDAETTPVPPSPWGCDPAGRRSRWAPRVSSPSCRMNRSATLPVRWPVSPMRPAGSSGSP